MFVTLPSEVEALIFDELNSLDLFCIGQVNKLLREKSSKKSFDVNNLYSYSNLSFYKWLVENKFLSFRKLSSW